ncbi:MAG: hypothetical protein ACFFB3_11745 [Candidatus Hodarchaeota archaeon]
MSHILDWTEPEYLFGAAIAAWVVTVVWWFIAPETILIPLVVAIALTLFAIAFFFIPIGESGSSPKTDKTTGKHRCRVCHQYFDELIDGRCQNCRQTLGE